MTPPKRTISLYHLTGTAGQTGNYPGSADVTVSEDFLPMDRKELLMEGGGTVECWELYFRDNPAADVRLNDKVVISDDSTPYYVRSIFDASYFGGLPHKRATISKQR